MNIDIKAGWDFILSKVRKHPVFTRILTQAILLITTFGWHNSSDFWHVICLGSMILMSVLNVSDGKLRKSTIPASEEVVEILQDAISDIIESNALDVADGFSENITVPIRDAETSEEAENVQTEEENEKNQEAEETEEENEKNQEAEETEEEINQEQQEQPKEEQQEENQDKGE
ncbi:MAG: hypothetical protein R3Y32_04130 [Bacillota bacterium]